MNELDAFYYQALKNKYFKAAVLREVTIQDEDEAALMRTWYARQSSYYRRKYAEQGLEHKVELPENYDINDAKPARRIDFVIFESKTITAVEMKISKNDFKRDTEQKRRPWQKVVNRFVYLTPAGMLTPEEIPDGCGLWEMQPDGTILSVKNARMNKNPEPFPQSMVKYLAWRAFAAEKLAGSQPPRIRKPRAKRTRPRRPRY
jgi:hypothetical protein